MTPVTGHTSQTMTPALSVVIPAVNGWADINRCLTALESEREQLSLEVIVPERSGPSVRQHIAERFPWVTVLPVTVSTSIPAMRAKGIRTATAPTVAVIEDHVIVQSGWACAIAAARTSTSRVVGGHLVNTATEKLVDWAAWLCEYHHLANPMPAGIVPGLHGNHTAYDRELLGAYQHVLDAEQWEDALHGALQADGVALWSRPDIVAGHCKYYSVREYTSQRFLYSRAYAAMRGASMTAPRRLAYGVMTVLLPPVLLWRIVRQVRASETNRQHLLPSLPLLVLFAASWGVGEMVGAWFGDGGALAKVK